MKPGSNIRPYFPYLQNNGTLCPLCGVSGDSQEHVLECSALGGPASRVEYSDLFRGVEEQNAVVKEYVERFAKREKVVATMAENVSACGESQAAEDVGNELEIE